MFLYRDVNFSLFSGSNLQIIFSNSKSCNSSFEYSIIIFLDKKVDILNINTVTKDKNSCVVIGGNKELKTHRWFIPDGVRHHLEKIKDNNKIVFYGGYDKMQEVLEFITKNNIKVKRIIEENKDIDNHLLR